MDKLRSLLQKIVTLDSKEIMRKVFSNPDVQELIVNLNTKGQLFQGVNSKGVSLAAIGGGYSEYTKRIKKSKGLPTDRVTLLDTGDLYRSFSVSVGSNGEVTILADLDKLEGRYGDDIVGLTPQSKDKVIEYIMPIVKEEIWNTIMT